MTRRIGHLFFVCSVLGALATTGTEPAQTTPSKAQPKRVSPVREQTYTRIKGQVLDDETGEPIPYFVLEARRGAAPDGTNPTWRGPIMTMPNSYTHKGGLAIPTPNPTGRFDHYPRILVPDEPDELWIRVVADGYEPRTIADRPFVPDDIGKTIELTVRLSRGRQIVGRVVDHAGNPSAGAKLFLIRPSSSITVNDDVMGEGSDRGLLDPGVTRTVADAQGRFRLPGIGDARAIGISAPTLYFTLVHIPPEGEEPTFRLAEPSALRIPYDIEGDLPEAEFQVLFKFPPDPLVGVGPQVPFPRLRVRRNPKVSNGKEIVMRDMPTGEYYLFRLKLLTRGDYSQRVTVESRDISVERGRVTIADFARPRGRRIAGQVLGPVGDKSRMSFVGIEPANAFDGRQRMMDVVPCDDEGRFLTCRIPPGAYVARVVGYRTRPRYGPFVLGIEVFDFQGSTPITVPADADPPEVRIELMNPRREPPPVKLGASSLIAK